MRVRRAEPNRGARAEWASGWKLVLASSLGFSFFSVMLSGTGLFMEPLGKAFGWNRTLLSSGPSIAVICTALLGPFFGMLVDRFGTRRLTLPGIVLTMLSMAAFGLLDGTRASWIAVWLVFGVVSVAIKSTGWTTAVAGMFTTSRGLALAVTLGGTALSQTIVPPLGNWLIESFGWRAAFVWLAVGWGGITFVVAWLFFFDPNDTLRGEEREARRRAQPVVPAARLPGLTVRQAVRDTALIRVAVSNFVVMVLTMGLSVHLFPILTDAGVSRAHAAWLTALGGISAIVGKVITGVLLDRFKPNWIGGVTLGIAALVFLLLLDGVRTPALIVFAMLVNGYAAGSKTQITAFLTAGYAGMKNFGAIYGFMSSLMSLAAGLGPLIAGAVYDHYHGYGPFLIAGTIGCTLGGVLVMTLPRYPQFDVEPEEALDDPRALRAPIAPGAV